MASEQQNFSLYQGEDEEIDFAVTGEDGQPLTMTGATIHWKAWNRRGEVVLSKTNGSSGASLVSGAGTNDTVRIVIVKADTVNLPPGRYGHECRVVNGGKEQVVAVGGMVLKASKTK